MAKTHRINSSRVRTALINHGWKKISIGANIVNGIAEQSRVQLFFGAIWNREDSTKTDIFVQIVVDDKSRQSMVLFCANEINEEKFIYDVATRIQDIVNEHQQIKESSG